ncbi:MAG: glycosyltransferase [Anaerolineae bacterium]
MKEVKPSVSVVIAARPGQVAVDAVSAARDLNRSPGQLEILVARGRQPSMQRNLAVREAHGEWVYFLDDDSRPTPGNLRRALAHFERPEVVMVGGPTACPPDAPWLEHLFQAVMGTLLAFGPSRARYRPVGQIRTTSEKELILCNLVVRKDPFLSAGGFDEALYPKEENALMDALQARGGILLYDPDMLVYRRPRRNLTAFVRMLFTYGRGRAEQFRLHPTAGSALNFLPPLFCLFVLATPWLPAWLAVLWLVYGAAVVGQALLSTGITLGQRPALVPLIFLSHLGYGLGFWRGLFTRLKHMPTPSPTRVELERIKLT